MVDNVISLRGGQINTGSQSNTGSQDVVVDEMVREALIKFLEGLLERARAGEIIGIAAATLEPTAFAAYHAVGHVGGFSMIGALMCAQQALCDVAMGYED